ncbi:uncharacterized protein LOC142341545 isoform X2 [Convolutriloba macropyga]|uniref:uncharacterized protein LOC142341545 isoform X2 n=1 Tax=Convolutriloba macropyga TaxID=536237 RepID=UPI003F526291
MSVDNGKQTLRFNTDTPNNVVTYERSEQESITGAKGDSGGGGDCVNKDDQRCNYWPCHDDDVFSDMDACSGCECSNCLYRGRCSHSVSDAAGDRTIGRYAQHQHNTPGGKILLSMNKLQKHLSRMGSFDAQEWLEKNKRFNRNGSYRIFNKSEVKQKKLAVEHFKTTYQLEFRDYGEIVRKATRAAQKSSRKNNGGHNSTRAGGDENQRQRSRSQSNGTMEIDASEDQVIDHSFDRMSQSISSVQGVPAAGKPSDRPIQPRKEPDCICCCDAYPYPHPNHEFNLQHSTKNSVSAIKKSKRQTRSLPKHVELTGCYPGGIPGNDILDRAEYSRQIDADINANVAVAREENNEGKHLTAPVQANISDPSVQIPNGLTRAREYLQSANGQKQINNVQYYTGESQGSFLRKQIPSAPAFIHTNDRGLSYASPTNPHGGIHTSRWTSDFNEALPINNKQPVGRAPIQGLRWADPVNLVERNFEPKTAISWTYPVKKRQNTQPHRKSSHVEVVYMQPSVRVENHIAQPLTGFNSTTYEDKSSLYLNTSNSLELSQPQANNAAKNRSSRGQEQKERQHPVRYRSHSSKAALTEELTKSQRISQFLEDVSRQLPITTASMKTSNPSTHRPHATESSVSATGQPSDDAKGLSKYPTYERTPTRSLDNEYQIMVVREPRPREMLRSPTKNQLVKSFTDMNYRTSPNTLPPKSASHYRSPKSSSSVITIPASSTPRLSEKTRSIMAKYNGSEHAYSDGQPTLQSSLHRLIGGPHVNNSASTSNIVTIEEFTQKRSSNVSAATQAMIKDVKAKSERLASRLLGDSGQDNKGVSTCTNNKHQAEKESTECVDDKIHDSNTNINTVPTSAEVSSEHLTSQSNHKNAQDLGHESHPKSNRKGEKGTRDGRGESIGGNGDARSFQKERGPHITQKSPVDEIPTKDSTQEQSNVIAAEDTKIESWSKLFTDTWSKIPQSRQSDEKDRIELESLMERLNSMSTELNSINQQLKKDVLQIPKALKVKP